MPTTVPVIVAPAVFAGVGDAAAAELVDGDVGIVDVSLSPHPVAAAATAAAAKNISNRLA